MDRKLFDAYDKMTMPDGCARRIEGLLRERAKPRKQQKNQVILRQKTGWRVWSHAAALVCLAVGISLGGFLLFLETQKQGDLPQVLQPTETVAAAESEDAFVPSEEGRDFLLAMCYAMPDWENYYVLNDQFWADFLYASFTCPEEVTETKAKTIIGEVPFEDGQVLISREQAEDYAALTMGCDLPVLSLGGAEDGGGIWYYDGFYHIRLSDFGSGGYELRKVVSYSGESCDAIFSAYVDETDNVVGSVRLKLRKADNENGFLIVGKQSELSLPEETIKQVENQDVLAEFSGQGDGFCQDTRETEAFTACQYRFPWDVEMLSAYDCVSMGHISFSAETGEILEEVPSRMFHQENGSWNQVELDAVILTGEKDGKTITVTMRCGAYGAEKRQPMDFLEANPGRWMEMNTGSRWWILGDQTTNLGDTAEDFWLLDPVTEELKDLWGAVPEDRRVHAIRDFVYTADIFEDGSFISAYLNEDRERCFLYADTVEGQVYDLETIVGRDLDDCVGLPNEEEIFCWSGGEYWRICRETMYPEYIGKLQENVVFASGVFGGDKALFSIEKMPEREGSYRIYDYVGNRFLTLETSDYEMWTGSTCVSPDGRKLLITGGRTMIEALQGEDIPIRVLDCENGTLLTIPRKGWDGEGNVYWLSGGEITICTYDNNGCVYTLK